MEGLAHLISAVAALLWSAAAIVFLVYFREELRQILKKLSHVRRGKILGQEFELENDDLENLKQLTDQAQKEVAEVLPPQNAEEKNTSDLDRRISKILNEASSSSKTKLMLLGPEIEKRLRQLLAATGWQSSIRVPPMTEAIEKLQSQGSLPNHVSSSLRKFLQVRNKILHGHNASDEDALSAIDSGVGVLHAIEAVPVERNVVFEVGVDIFSNEECSQLIGEAKGLILEATSPDGTTKNFRIYPTTRRHFVKGKRVAWEWNFDHVWGPAWYKDPENGKTKQAWLSSAEFIGRDLDEV